MFSTLETYRHDLDGIITYRLVEGIAASPSVVAALTIETRETPGRYATQGLDAQWAMEGPRSVSRRITKKLCRVGFVNLITEHGSEAPSDRNTRGLKPTRASWIPIPDAQAHHRIV